MPASEGLRGRVLAAGRRCCLTSSVFDSLEVAGLSVGKFRA